MAARARRGSRLALVVFLLAGLFAVRDVPMRAGPAPVIGAVEGAGTLDKLACLGCGGGILAAGGGTLGGVLVLGLFWGDALAGCAYLCYVAYF